MSPARQGTVKIERRIAAPPEIVFSFFTDPVRYRRWQGFDAELDPRPGGIYRVTITGRTHVVARGVFVEVEPPKRLVFTWGWEPRDGLLDGMDVLPGTSTVEVELAVDGDGTLLRMRHSGLPTEAAEDLHIGGWNLALDRLVIAAAGGDPGPDPLTER